MSIRSWTLSKPVAVNPPPTTFLPELHEAVALPTLFGATEVGDPVTRS
jgi:hypothetical protein